MIDETQEERASLYVLGFMEKAEMEELERELAQNPEFAKLVSELSLVTEKLALSLPQSEPQPGLREKIMSRIEAQRPAPGRSGSWLAWAAALLLLLATAWLFADRNRLQDRVSVLERRDAMARLEIKTLTSLIAQNPNAGAVVVWDVEKQTGVLQLENVPQAAANQDYQLWIVDPQYPAPVDAGIFSAPAEGKAEIRFRPSKPVKEVSKIAVSLERKGGVEKAQGPMILISN